MNRNGEISIVSETGRERERYVIVYGAKLKVTEGQQVEPETLLAEWDPFTTPILTEVAGRHKVRRYHSKARPCRKSWTRLPASPARWLSNSGNPTCGPRISIKDEKGKTSKVGEGGVARYFMPVGAILMVTEGRSGLPRRRSCKNSARDHQDQGHHRRSAQGRRTLRSAQAQGKRRDYRNRRRGRLRKRHQGQAQGRRYAPGGRSARVPDSRRASTSACTKAIMCAPARPLWTARPILTTS